MATLLKNTKSWSWTSFSLNKKDELLFTKQLHGSGETLRIKSNYVIVIGQLWMRWTTLSYSRIAKGQSYLQTHGTLKLELDPCEFESEFHSLE